MPSLVSLARSILRNAEFIERATGQGDPISTNQNDCALDLDKARTEVLNAAHKLRLNVQSPESYLFEMMWSVTDVLALKMIYSLRLPHHVPLESSIPYDIVATSLNLDTNIVSRIFRYAITIGFFTEPFTDHVAHSKTTRMLATKSNALDAMGMILCELGPATDHYPEALEKFGASEELNETAYNIANQTDLAMYQFLATNPETERRFGSAMGFFSGDGSTEMRTLIEAFPWTSEEYDRTDFTTVDVGGGHGSVSTKLAAVTKKMRFVVQDKENEIVEGRSRLPDALKNRVDFQVHDFFMPQPVVDADVYLFRWILHNWGDKYVKSMLQNLIPALKKGARILVFEHVMEEGVDMLLSMKRERYLDLFMMCAYNSRERTEKDYKALFESVDNRFMFQRVTTFPGSSMSLIEARWIE